MQAEPVADNCGTLALDAMLDMLIIRRDSARSFAVPAGWLG